MKTNGMKKLLTAFLLIFISTAAFAGSYSKVMDTCGVFTEDQKAQLIVACEQIEDLYNIGVYLVAVNDPDVYDVESYAEQVYKDNDFGYGSEKNGIMLLLNFAEREYDIVGYGSKVHAIYTDRTRSNIAEDFLPYFKNDNWYEGYSAFVKSAYSAAYSYEKAHAPKINNSASGIARYINTEILAKALLAGFIAALLIALISCLAMKSQMKSVKQAKRADFYVLSKDIKISLQKDVFTHNTTVVRDIPQASNNGGGTTINSGGFSHSSGKF